jgi:hypothetical protein
MNISPFLSVDYPCDQTLTWTREQLLQAGLRPVQTFDLHAARAASHDCSCPNHGTDKCDCQLVVLLVYGNVIEPVTLILHGNDGQTWLSFGSSLIQHTDEVIRCTIEHILQSDAAT